MDIIKQMNSIEICAGAGGQALGLEMAGFDHAALVEIEPPACATLSLNRPRWNVVQGDVRQFNGLGFRGADLVCGGVPCPPFSVAGKQLGPDDERDLFPEALRLVEEIRPQAVMLENVWGLLEPKFAEYRQQVEAELTARHPGRWALPQPNRRRAGGPNPGRARPVPVGSATLLPIRPNQIRCPARVDRSAQSGHP